MDFLALNYSQTYAFPLFPFSAVEFAVTEETEVKMNEEILVSGDMRISMLEQHAPRFGTYQKISRIIHDRVAYRHKNTKIDSFIWYNPEAGWLIGPSEHVGTVYACLQGYMDSPTPVHPCRWSVLVDRTKWTLCDSIIISYSTSLETNHGQSINVGSSKEHSIQISEHEEKIHNSTNNRM